ncbi:MAG: TonB-dependent receptor, partial [Bacteroidota bacterium]
EETNNSANLNLTIPFRQWNGLASRFKVGGSYLAKDRTFRERQFAFRYDGGSYPLNEYEGDVGAFVDAELGIDDERTTERRTRFGLYVTDLSQPSNNYDGDQEVAAGYVMLDMPLMPSLRFVGGVRYETTEINVASLNEDIEPGELSEADLLPSLGLTWEANEQTNLRLAYGRTLARPTFRELAPFSGFEFVGDVILLGNPGLERTLIDSYDARWEWFVRPGEIYAVSAFYKGFENPIERAFDPRGTGGNGQVTFVNVPEGTVYGLEFEVRKRLDQLGDAFQNFQAGANLTLTQSEVDIEAEELDARRQTNPDAPDTRSFSGQSAFVFNIDLGYNNPERGTSLNVFYNVFGERLLEAGRGGTPDIFEQPRNDFDITFTQRLISGFTLKASAKNLLNAKYEITQEYLGTEYILQDYDLGRSFSIGVSYGL